MIRHGWWVLHGLILGLELMVNRSPFPLIPQSIGSQSPPVFTSLGMAGQFAPRRRPPYPRQGDPLDHHVPSILRGCWSPRGRLGGLFPLESHVVRGIAQVKRSQIVQTGVFVRGIVPWCRGSTVHFSERFRLGDCSGSPRLSRVSTHHPYRMVPLLRMPPLPHFYFIPFTHIPDPTAL